MTIEVDPGVDEHGEPKKPNAQSEDAASSSDSDSVDILGILGVPDDSDTPVERTDRRPRGRARPRDNGHVDAEPEIEEEEDEDEIETKKSRQFGGEVPAELAELFTPQGFGQIMAEGTSSLYELCEAEPYNDTELNISSKVWAYYIQKRLPPDWAKAQPEILLGLTLLIPACKHGRLEKVAKKSKGFFTTIGGWIAAPFRFFSKKKTPETGARTSEHATS